LFGQKVDESQLPQERIKTLIGLVGTEPVLGARAAFRALGVL